MYSTIQDILKDLDESEVLLLINDGNGDVDEIDLTDSQDTASLRVIEQIKAADDEIDSYLRSRYPKPFTEVPERIRQISKDIAIYNLYKRRHRLDMPESIVAIYKSRIADLEKIQKGVINPIIEPDQPGIQGKVNKTESDKIFSSTLLNKF